MAGRPAPQLDSSGSPAHKHNKPRAGNSHRRKASSLTSVLHIQAASLVNKQRHVGSTKQQPARGPLVEPVGPGFDPPGYVSSSDDLKQRIPGEAATHEQRNGAVGELIA
jgi:hypothetical protein